MVGLLKFVNDALDEYDFVAENVSGTSEERVNDLDAAAHECVETIREAVKALPELTQVLAKEVNLNNPIAQLQERAQATAGVMPVYAFSQDGSAHPPRLTCLCEAEGVKHMATESSKQMAKRRAARMVLAELMGVSDGAR